MGLFRLTKSLSRRVSEIWDSIHVKYHNEGLRRCIYRRRNVFRHLPNDIGERLLIRSDRKHVSRTQDDIQLEGANASAEEADEGTDAASESGVDVILNHRLVETGFGSKKDYTVYLKDYMKKVIAYLEENDMKDQVEGFKKNIQAVMGDLLKKFKDLQFFTGESMNPDAMILMVEYRDVDGEERPIIMGFKHGLREVKC